MLKLFGFDKNKRDLLWELIKTNFKMRYQNSVLGILWVLIKPYATFIVLFSLWTNIRGDKGIPNYGIYLLFGIVFYTFFNELVSLGQSALLDRANIILKVSFPRQIAIMAALVNSIINLGINMVLILFIMFINHIPLTALGLGYFLFIIFMVFVFTLGLAFFTSIITVRFRDLKNIFDLGLFLLYWATPIFYSLDTNIATGTMARLIGMNPIGIVMNQGRAALGIFGEIDWPLMLIYLGVSLVFAALGWMFFSVNVRKVAEFF